MILKAILGLVITFIQECPQALRVAVTEWPEFMLTEHGLHQRLAVCSLSNKNGLLNGLTPELLLGSYSHKCKAAEYFSCYNTKEGRE